MRKFHTSLLFFFTLPLFAQDVRLLKRAAGSLEVSEVVLLDSFPASQLYFNSTLFLSEAFNGARETSQIKDPKAKSVATKGSFPVSIFNGYGEEIKARVVFTLIIQSRENAFKYTLNDFYFAYTEETGITSYASFNDQRGLAMSPKQWRHVEEQTEEFIRDFVDDLKEQMTQQEILCKEMLTSHKKKGKGK
jgi:hypothetical protein